MPHLTEFAEITSHLREALVGKTHWLMLTDCKVGHVGLSNMAIRLALTGIVSQDDLNFGDFDYCNKITNHHCVLSFLTVPKALIARKALGRLLNSVSRGICPESDDQDLIILADTKVGQENAIHFLSAVRDGKVFFEAPENN